MCVYLSKPESFDGWFVYGTGREIASRVRWGDKTKEGSAMCLARTCSFMSLFFFFDASHQGSSISGRPVHLKNYNFIKAFIIFQISLLSLSL